MPPLPQPSQQLLRRLGAASNERSTRMRAALEDLSKMALESTDPDPAYSRAYADIAAHVRQRAKSALTT